MLPEPIITVLCPTYNEVDSIETVLRFFTESQPKEKELYVIDGGSTDGTINIVERWSQQYESIHLLFNKHKYVPQALNLGLSVSKGKIIIRLDAHTIYENNYFEKIIETFENTQADIVGGPMRAAGITDIQKAIAYATSGWFGIGDSKFHDPNFKGYVDSVYLGAWKINIFNDVGFFDERMVRNQDDEFHYRAKSKGKKIYLNPEIKSTYFPRSTYFALFKQYFQYGFYKPYVIKKIKTEIKLRHLIPLFFIIYLFCLPFAVQYPIIFLPLLIYSLADLFCSFFNSQTFKVKLSLLFVYPIIHISYGMGFLLGLGKILFIGDNTK